MKVSLTVKNRDEACAVQTAWDDPQIRAFVLVVGTLLQLPSDRARLRVLQFVTDKFAEESVDQGTEATPAAVSQGEEIRSEFYKFKES